jgi:hypothetical protein
MQRAARLISILMTLGTLTTIAVGVAGIMRGQQAMAQDTKPMPQPVEHASADDCAIIVEVGKQKMGWGATVPDAAFYIEFDREGGGTYLEDCPWRDLSVGEPMLKDHPQMSFFIPRPRYTGQRAIANFHIVIQKPLIDGQTQAPYLRLETCTLEKQDNVWRLVECRVTTVT